MLEIHGLVKYFAVIVFFINIILILFTAFTLGSGLQLNVPALNTVGSYQANMSTTTNIIATAITKPTISPSTCNTGDYVCIAYNAGIALFNIIIGFVSIVINILILLALGFGIVILLLFLVFPQFLAVVNLGFLGTLLFFINGGVILIMVFYGFEIILQLVRHIRGAPS